MVSQPRVAMVADVAAECWAAVRLEAGMEVAKVVATGVGRSGGERAEPMEADLEAAMEVDAAASANTDLEAAPPLW